MSDTQNFNCDISCLWILYQNILNAHLQICFASCFDQDIIQDLKSKKGKEISITLKTSGLIYRYIYFDLVVSSICMSYSLSKDYFKMQ